jgi:hypothetical protein
MEEVLGVRLEDRISLVGCLLTTWLIYSIEPRHLYFNLHSLASDGDSRFHSLGIRQLPLGRQFQSNKQARAFSRGINPPFRKSLPIWYQAKYLFFMYTISRVLSRTFISSMAG